MPNFVMFLTDDFLNSSFRHFIVNYSHEIVNQFPKADLILFLSENAIYTLLNHSFWQNFLEQSPHIKVNVNSTHFDNFFGSGSPEIKKTMKSRLNSRMNFVKKAQFVQKYVAELQLSTTKVLKY